MIDKNADKPQTRFIITTVVLSFAVSLMFAEWVLGYQRQLIQHSEQMDEGMILYDARLGWKLSPMWNGRHRHHDFDVSYSINRAGFRGEHPVSVAGSRADYAIVGDSFSFGLGVDDEQTFTAQLNRNNPQASFYNYSVPGYSTDQQLLLIDSHPQISRKNIVLVVYLGNDLFDNMLAYPLQADHGKPYFSVREDGSLELNNTPVPLTQKPAAARKTSISSLVVGDSIRQGAISQWLSGLELSRRTGLFQSDVELTEGYLNSRFAESLDTFFALVQAIDSKQKQGAGHLSVVILPGRSYVESAGSLSAQYQEFFRQQILTGLQLRAIEVFDLAGYLVKLYHEGSSGEVSSGLYHPNEGHLTAQGHQLVAHYLEDKLLQPDSR